jgi:hypothetical protein
MKKIVFITVTLLAITFQSCKKYDAFGKEILFEEVYKAHWLLGEWQKEDSLGVLKEIWTQKDDSTYSGLSYYIKEKDTIHREKIELMQNKEALIYTTIIEGQNGNNPLLLQLTKDTDSLLVFENPKNEHPQKIEYKLVNAKNVICTITGIQNGKRLIDEYNFSKNDTLKKDKK